MRINFRQGLIAFQKDAGNPVYLQQSTTAGYVSHVVSPTTTLVTFAHGSTDYLQAFDTSVDLAWGPFPSGVDSHLYWDIDLLTSEVTRGFTTLLPINSLTAPNVPANDQHWFDLTTNKMKVWSAASNKWRERVRVFAGRVVLGNSNNLVMFGEGSQVGLSNVPSNPGFIVLDTLLQPIRKSVGEFLTDEDQARVRTTTGTGGVLVQPVNRVVPVRAGEPIPRMSLVYFSGPDTVRLASSNPALMPARIPVGVCLDPLASGDVGTITINGEITYDQWDWTGNEGAPVYCDSAGTVTLNRPSGLMAYRVGFVKNAQTILFNVDAETLPQVYTADINSLIITADAPLYATDNINGLGERVVTIAGPNASGSTNGFMTSAQFTLLASHETRLLTAETDIDSLEATKSNVGHTHAIADVSGLQPALDVLTNSLAAKADKVVGAINGHFAALNASGNLVDSGRSHNDYALIVHTHTIPDVTGLQTALDQKAYRNHLNAFSEIYTTVDRSGAFDAGVGQTLTAALADKSDVGHIHTIADVSTLQTTLDNKSDVGHGHAIADVTGLQLELDNRAFVSHTHSIANVTGLQTALDNKAPLVHTHIIADTSGLQAALDDKAPLVHNHAIADVSGLQLELDNRAFVSHGHVIGDVTGLQTALDNKSDVGHGHAIGDVTGLQDALDDKAALVHGHAIADVTGLQTELDGKAFVVHTHTAAQVTDFAEAVDDRVAALLVAGTNVTLDYDDNANTLTVNSTGSGGTSYFRIADRFAPQDFNIDIDDDFMNPLADGGNVTVSTVGPVDTTDSTQIKFTDSPAYQEFTYNVADGQSVENGFTWHFVIQRDGSSIGAEFTAIVQTTFGGPSTSLAVTYQSHSANPSFQDSLRVIDDGNTLLMIQPAGLFVNQADSHTFDLTVNGTTATLLVDNVQVGGTLTLAVDRSIVGTRIAQLYHSSAAQAGAGTGPNSPGFVGTRINEGEGGDYWFNGEPVPPNEYQVDTSSDHDKVVLQNIGVTQADADTMILQQQVIVVQDDAADVLTYPAEGSLSSPVVMNFDEGLSVERSGLALTIKANTIQNMTISFMPG